ncbi:response regulator transcription factor [Chamaesiphon sp. OTE_8_metabat_110]|uniref:response regulator transcription factor n=1 Tax=Chamaesiphon sp. OTE_8_metabat_110 TaxID=2964696 RepID=UPI00286CCA5C|nr:response regulator transcription factor [Chamaesiphon sp. OTE_8_metabat_110]
MPQILIAEDEPRISAFIEKGLRAQGFTSTIAHDVDEVLDLAQRNEFDLILLDLGLPGGDGLEILETLRGQGVQTPIIILTARDDLNDKLAGLGGGADDYMTKPFRFEELLVRIRLRMKPKSIAVSSDDLVLIAGSVALNLRTRTAIVNEREIELPSREFILAEAFFQHPGQVLTRQQLLDRVWGYDYDPGSNIVDVYVGYLRKKLGSDLFETVRGVGYRLKN